MELFDYRAAKNFLHCVSPVLTLEYDVTESLHPRQIAVSFIFFREFKQHKRRCAGRSSSEVALQQHVDSQAYIEAHMQLDIFCSTYADIWSISME